MLSLEKTIEQHLAAIERQSYSTDGAVSIHLLKLALEELRRRPPGTSKESK